MTFDKSNPYIYIPLLSFTQNKAITWKDLIIVRTEIKGSDVDPYCNYHGNKSVRKLKD